jgi:hypothetical protein
MVGALLQVVHVISNYIYRCTFGYLVIIIFLKWNTNYFFPVDRTNASPGLLNVMINMVLGGGEASVESLYRGQATCERVLVVLAVLCVPIMFVPKPAIIHLGLIAKRRGLPSIWALIQSYTRYEDMAGGFFFCFYSLNFVLLRIILTC